MPEINQIQLDDVTYQLTSYNEVPNGNSSTLGKVKISDTADSSKTAAGSWALSPAGAQKIIDDNNIHYHYFVKGTTPLSIPFAEVKRGVIITVRYGGNINQEVSIVFPKDDAFDSTTHRYYASIFLGTWRIVRVASNGGNFVLEYAGDGGSLDETNISYIKGEAF